MPPLMISKQQDEIDQKHTHTPQIKVTKTKSIDVGNMSTWSCIDRILSVSRYFVKVAITEVQSRNELNFFKSLYYVYVLRTEVYSLPHSPHTAPQLVAQYTEERRHREFQELYTALHHHFPYHIIPPLSTVTRRTNTQSQVADTDEDSAHLTDKLFQRRRQLALWLQYIAMNSFLIEHSTDLSLFFTGDEHSFTSLAQALSRSDSANNINNKTNNITSKSNKIDSKLHDKLDDKHSSTTTSYTFLPSIGLKDILPGVHTYTDSLDYLAPSDQDSQSLYLYSQVAGEGAKAALSSGRYAFLRALAVRRLELLNRYVTFFCILITSDSQLISVQFNVLLVASSAPEGHTHKRYTPPLKHGVAHSQIRLIATLISPPQAVSERCCCWISTRTLMKSSCGK
jgi:hypothetical protein